MAQTLALSLLILVLALCIPWTQGSDGGGQDCCLKYSRRKIPYSIVRGYRRQEPSLGCTVSAILFLPRKRSQPELCANPEEGWVQKLMKCLDQSAASGKQSPDCRKSRGTSKPGRKGKGSKGWKRTDQTQVPRGP
ncbi:C-C motif chemokine 21 [Phodopus roborovskii]|uniref:6Ckine n=1 Tax=Phodopus roborovskii TaxID=109678 RepID=A0AAU9ZEY9_PHORO|nr:C-C motif chemokine 21 [Phodopus roborovskii]CAH6790280.1 Ccl21 [Phodopus roborovskii]